MKKKVFLFLFYWSICLCQSYKSNVNDFTVRNYDSLDENEGGISYQIYRSSLLGQHLYPLGDFE